jgi:hypothetical protein
MLSVEQRVTIVEERMVDHSQLFTDLRQGLRQFEARVDARFAAVDARFTAIDARFTAVDERFTAVDARFTGLDARITELGQKVDAGLAALTSKIDAGLTAAHQRMDIGFTALNQRLDTQGGEITGLRRDMTMQMAAHLRWTVGVMLTGFVAIVAAVLAG